jgi:glycosyltransferase involved in cell wall biosynthesis
MKSIIQITPYYPPHLGGMERVVENLATRLGRDHNVTVLTTTLGGRREPRRFSHDRVTIRRHRSVEFAHTPIAPGLLLSLLCTPRRAVLHLHSAHALFPELVAAVARLRSQRFLIHYHLDVDASGRLGRLLPYYKKHVFARVLRAAAGVIALTTAQADFIERTYGVPAHRIHVVPNGVGDEYFMTPRSAPSPGERLRLLFVGRLSAQKNVTRLLDALAMCRQPVDLTVVGDGEQRNQLERHARLLQLSNVIFTGPRFGTALRATYASAHAFVLPSDREGMPLVALEAMAAGLPIVATRVPGNIELLDGVAAMAEASPGCLAAEVDKLAGNRRQFELLARRSAESAREYTWTAVVERVQAVYGEAAV